MNNILEKIAYYFWLGYYSILAIPVLLPLLIEREYLYLKLMIIDIFYND
jgi:hypothetical protein